MDCGQLDMRLKKTFKGEFIYTYYFIVYALLWRLTGTNLYKYWFFFYFGINFACFFDSFCYIGFETVTAVKGGRFKRFAVLTDNINGTEKSLKEISLWQI